MAILFAGNFAHLLGVPVYHSTATTGRDPAMTPAHVMLPQVGQHSIGFSLDLSQTTDPELWMHCRMHATEIGNMSTGGGSIFHVADNGPNFWHVQKASSTAPTFAAQAEGTSTVSGASWAAVAGLTYTMDFRARRVGPDLIAEFYVDGALVSTAQRPVRPSTRWASATLTNALGRRTSGTNSIFVSEVVLATTSTIGMRVATLQPLNPGHHAEWTGAPGDVADFDPLTGVTANLSGLRQTRVHTPAPAGTVAAVVATAAMTNTAPLRASRLVRIGGVDHLSAPAAPDAPNGPSNVWRDVMPVNPATNAAWTTADLAALDAGLRSEP